jgi:RNA polymerase sigma-70 factor (ECF subfamily)
MDPAASPEHLRQAPDAALVRAVAGGDPEAVAELHDRYAPMLLGLARKVVKDRNDAEEVVQEAFVHVWNRAGTYDGSRSSVATWLVLITRSRAIDRVRSRNVVERTHATVRNENRAEHASAEGTVRVLHGERRRRVREELAGIPDEQRQVLELAFYKGLTQREIAEHTGIPLGTVKTRTLLAMKKLRTALRDEIRELL